MKDISIRNIAQIVGGSLKRVAVNSDDYTINQISIDSRTIKSTSGCLFVALHGERHNGHRYLSDLYLRGVRYFLVSEDVTCADYPEGIFVQVENTLSALQSLSAAHRRKYTYPVLAITGSNGKTIIKEWLYSLLHHELKIIRSPRSYNSQVGVPLSVLNMDDEHQMAIFEAGISKPKEMEVLQRIVQADYGIVSNIGEAHQKNFANKTEKINEKLKLFNTCKKLVYCADQVDLARNVEAMFSPRTRYAWSTNVKNTTADLHLQYRIAIKQSIIIYKHARGEGEVVFPFVDSASLENASHCLAFILMLGLESEQVLDAFAYLQPIAMRLEIKSGINDCQLINDFYNSDLNSLEIALQFQSNHSSKQGQQACLILSDIEQTEYADEELGKRLCKLLYPYNLHKLVLVGRQWEVYCGLLNVETECYASTDDFLAHFEARNYRNLNILLKGARYFRFERISAVLQQKYHQTQLEVDLSALVENLNHYKALLRPTTKMMVMVKALSYGTGSVEIAKALAYQQVDYLAVAVADEGMELRQSGVDTPIIVMNPEYHSFEMMMDNRLEPNIYSPEVFHLFQKTAERMAVCHYPIHLKLETGMHRLGFDDEAELQHALQLVSSTDTLRVASCFTHLAVSDDSAEDTFTHTQHKRFLELSRLVLQVQPQAMCHILNSAGIERFPEYQHDMVRLGIGLYGYAQSSCVKTKVVACWTSLVSQVKVVKSGNTIGYGRVGKANEDKKIAIIPVGYADGYNRRLSNGVGKVWIAGHEYPVIGNICMDMCMIDITGSNIIQGTRVELMGEHITMQRLARWIGTIPYEVLTSISQRVKRVYVQE